MANKPNNTPAAAPEAEAPAEAVAPVAVNEVTGIAQYEGIQVVDNTEAVEAAPVEVATDEYEITDGLTQVNYL